METELNVIDVFGCIWPRLDLEEKARQISRDLQGDIFAFSKLNVLTITYAVRSDIAYE